MHLRLAQINADYNLGTITYIETSDIIYQFPHTHRRASIASETCVLLGGPVRLEIRTIGLDGIRVSSMVGTSLVHRRPGAAVVLATFSLHNGWNCWMSMNFVNFAPGMELLGVDEPTIGIINACGFLGILAGVPAVIVCRWPRTLLIFSGLLNVLPALLRYYAALSRNWQLIAASNFLNCAAFGVIGAWPPMLATAQWANSRRLLVISVASLSNYVGGALGTLLMPQIASTASRLLEVLRLQVYGAALLGALLCTWLWIPPVIGSNQYSPAQQLSRLCHRHYRGALVQLAVSCLLVGCSLLLAGLNQFLLTGFGMSDTSAGAANTVYQLASCLVGVGLGSCVATPRSLRRVLFVLHVVLAVAVGGVAALCSQLRQGRLPDGSGPAVFSLMCLLGGSLMGMLPFLMQQAETSLQPLPENIVSGLLYFGATLITAALTQLCTLIPQLTSVKLVGGLLTAAVVYFCWSSLLDWCAGAPASAQVYGLLRSSDDALLLDDAAEGGSTPLLQRGQEHVTSCVDGARSGTGYCSLGLGGPVADGRLPVSRYTHSHTQQRTDRNSSGAH